MIAQAIYVFSVLRSSVNARNVSYHCVSNLHVVAVKSLNVHTSIWNTGISLN